MLRSMLMRPRRWWSGLELRDRRHLLVFALVLFAYGFFQQQPVWNEYSRYDLVRAIVEQGTIQIDSFHQNTGDKAFYDGHWYSDKPPGSALLGVPIYGLLVLTSWLTGAGTPGEVEAVGALAFGESGVTTALLVVLLVRFLGPVVGERWALTVGLAYGLGSMAFPFATMFFGHAASAAALFGSFYLLHGLRAGTNQRLALAAGFLAGWAVLTEIPTVLGVAALLVYALSISRGAALRFIAGGLPVALVLFAYNWLAFDNPFSLGYQHATIFGEQNAQGIVSIVWPKLETAGELLFSERGLLRLAPWLALAPLGLLALRRPQLRFEVVLFAVICAAFLTYNSGALNPFGGWTPGPRYLLPALPFAAVLVGLVPARLRVVALPLMLAAAAIFLVATTTMPNAPESYDDPLLELWLPRFTTGWFAETAAWLRWGVPGFAALAVLLLGLGFGLTAVVLSFGRGALAARVVQRGPIALGILVLAFSFPFPPPAPVRLAVAEPHAPVSVAVVALGHTRIVVDGDEEIQLWALVENRGGAIAASRLHFSVWRPTGEGVWSAFYGGIAVEAGARRTVTMTWRPEDAPAGLYRYGFSISDATTGAIYVDVVDQDAATVGR
jgi:hypothetical protein